MKKLLKQIGLVLVTFVSIYMASALMLSHFGQLALSDFMYPFNTNNKMKILEQTEDLEDANALADEILKLNAHHYAPYSVKAKYSYSEGDFGALIEYKNKVFQANPFDHTEYEEYCQMLINGITLYENAGDQASAKICREELRNAQKLLNSNKRRLSKLGSMITDQPVTELSPDVQIVIQQIGG